MRMQLLVEKCIKPSPYEHCTSMFEAPLERLYEKRWAAVQQFLESAKPRLIVLRRAFDARCFSAQDAEGEEADEANGLGKFNPRALQEALQSNLFHAYLSMALKLHDLVHWALRHSELGSGSRVCSFLAGVLVRWPACGRQASW